MTCHYRDMIRYLESVGFKSVSHKGSHRKFRDKADNTIIIPVHPNKKNLKKGIYHRITKQLKQYGYERK